MNTLTLGTSTASQPGQPDVVVGCATCWAAKYCAIFSLAGPQPPPACPLLPKPAPRQRPRRPRSVHY